MSRSNQGKMFADLPPGARILLGKDISTLSHSAGLIEPFSASHLAPCSYDFSAGDTYVVAGGGAMTNTSKEPLVLGPGSYAGVMSKERVVIPANIYTFLGPKRKLSYDGIILLSGSVIDPGYEGHLLFVLYNSSGRKRTIFPGKKIFVGTFFQLDEEVPEPLGPDPDLAAGNFPGQFLDSMANMELPSMVEITEKIKEMNALQVRVHELEKNYTDVVKPIRDLTEDVSRVTRSVESLTEQGAKVLGKLGQHDEQLGIIGNTLTDHGVRLSYASRLATILVTALITLAGSLAIALVVYFVTHYVGPSAPPTSTSTGSATTQSSSR